MNNNENVTNSVQPSMVTSKKNNQPIIIGVVVIIAVIAAVLLYDNLLKTKKLRCTMSEESAGMSLNSDFNLDYQGKKLKAMKMTMEIDLGENASYKDMILKQYESQLGDQIDKINEKGGKASITSTDDTINVEISADRSGVSTMISTDSDDYSYDAMKEQIEEMGYTCK